MFFQLLYTLRSPQMLDSVPTIKTVTNTGGKKACVKFRSMFSQALLFPGISLRLLSCRHSEQKVYSD